MLFPIPFLSFAHISLSDIIQLVERGGEIEN